MGSLCDALRGQLLQVDEEPQDFLEALDVLGDNPAAAEFFAGTGDRSSSAYKAALRRVQRYRANLTGAKERRAPMAEDLEKLLEGAQEVITTRAEKLGDGPVTIAGTVQVSSDTRKRTIRGDLSGDCRERIAALLAEDLCDEAEEAFEECFGQENGMGDTPHWTDVDGLAL